MPRVLRTDVYVAGEHFIAGSTPPEQYARRITNPAAWEDDMTDPNGQQVGDGTQVHADPPTGHTGGPEPRPGPTPVVTTDQLVHVEQDDTDDPDPDPLQPNTAVPPPRSGKGSGIDAWEAFATANGIAVNRSTGRDEIIAACEDAGLIRPA